MYIESSSDRRYHDLFTGKTSFKLLSEAEKIDSIAFIQFRGFKDGVWSLELYMKISSSNETPLHYQNTTAFLFLATAIETLLKEKNTAGQSQSKYCSLRKKIKLGDRKPRVGTGLGRVHNIQTGQRDRAPN